MATDTLTSSSPLTPPVAAGAATPTGPDAYRDLDAIKSLVLRKREEWGKGRELITRSVYRNILFYRGTQWVRWDRGMSRFRPAILPKGTPTPVTNVFAASMDAINSVFARVEPKLSFAPGNPDEPEDRATADVASRAMEAIEDETEIRVNRQMLAVWVGFAGGAWLENGYDPDPIYGMVTLEAEACATCQATQAPGPGMCDTCGSPTTPTQMQAPKGKQYVDVCSIFEMFFDPSVTDWSKQRGYIRERSVSEDHAKARWPALKERIKADSAGGSIDETYASSLPTIGPQIDDNAQARWQQATRPLANRVSERWYWQLPDETYPQGLLAVIVSKTEVAYAGPLPYGALQADGSRQPFLPHVFFPQKLVPGSAFPKTVADDLALKQTDRNKWESIVQACGMRMGSPIWLRPQGSNARNLTGEPGQVVDYQSIPGSNLKPERIQGQGIPLAFIQKIEMCDKEMENLGATFDIIKGARPQGVSAGIALQILQERGMSRFGPQFILWEAAWAQQAKIMIEIFRQYATEERMLRIKGRDGAWEIKKFIGADLQGRVDVIPEAGSSMPRSTITERAEVEQLIGLGVLNRADPEVAFKILELYGKTHLLPSLQRDTKNAIMENEEFAALAHNPLFAKATPDDVAAAQAVDYPTLAAIMETKYQVKIPRVRSAVDDHTVHSREIGAWLKSESARALPEIIQVIAEKHKEYHDTLMIQQAQARQGLMQPMTPGYMAMSNQPGQASQPSPLNSSSSPERMAGDMNEMQSDMAAGTATP